VSHDDEVPCPEPFGPIYERPQGAPCPDCDCCTARLCETAESAGLSCVQYAAAGDAEVDAGCPCTTLDRKDGAP
jgi:hypothetical protein